MSAKDIIVAILASLAFCSFFFGWLTFGTFSFSEQNVSKARVMFWGPLVLAFALGVVAWLIAG